MEEFIYVIVEKSFLGEDIVTLKRKTKPQTIKIYVIKRLFYCSKI